MQVVTIEELLDMIRVLGEELRSGITRAMEIAKLPAYYTRAEAAEYLRISKSSLDRYTQSGKLRHIKLGDGPKASVRYRKADLDAFMEEHLVMDEVTARRAAKKMRLS
jgi:excisionase family DNA binding protein